MSSSMQKRVLMEIAMKCLNLNPKGAFVAACVLVASLLFCPATATASLIAFDTFGPGDSYNTGARFGVDGNADFQAFQFVPTESGTLDNITVALGRTGTGTSATQFDLFDGTAGALGALLESFVVPNNVAPGTSLGEVVTFSSIGKPLLNSGQIYWLSYSEPNAADGSSSLWFFNDQGLSGTRLTSVLSAATNVLPAFRIDLGEVPEPSTILLLGLAGLAFFARRS